MSDMHVLCDGDAVFTELQYLRPTHSCDLALNGRFVSDQIVSQELEWIIWFCADKLAHAFP